MEYFDTWIKINSKFSNDKLKWCLNKLGPQGFKWNYSIFKETWYFKYSEDATLFLLTWG